MRSREIDSRTAFASCSLVPARACLRALLAGDRATCIVCWYWALREAWATKAVHAAHAASGAARLLSEALRAGIERWHRARLISDMRVPAPPEAVKNGHGDRVHTLGRFEVRLHGQPLEFSRKATKKTLALLKAIIAFGGANVSEQRLLDTFWRTKRAMLAAVRDSSGASAARVLRGPGCGDPAGRHAALDDSRVWVDALALDARLAGDSTMNAEALRQLTVAASCARMKARVGGAPCAERLRQSVHSCTGR